MENILASWIGARSRYGGCLTFPRDFFLLRSQGFFPLEKLVENGPIARIQPENTPSNEISCNIKCRRRQLRPPPMDHEAKEQSGREWGERDEPRFDQCSPRPTPLEEPRNLDPAEDPFEQIGKKNPERRPERTEGWNEHEIQTDGGGEGDSGV